MRTVTEQEQHLGRLGSETARQNVAEHVWLNE